MLEYYAPTIPSGTITTFTYSDEPYMASLAPLKIYSKTSMKIIAPNKKKSKSIDRR
jgi:hypothetical protein